jgi:hypothetical protein
MPIEDFTIGTNLTAQTGLHFSQLGSQSDEEHALLTASFAAIGRQLTTEGLLDQAEAWAKTILLDAGFPTEPFKWFRIGIDGQWVDDLPEPLPPNILTTLQPGESLRRGSAIPECTCAVDSPPGYAARILEKIALIRRAVAQGAAEQAAVCGIHLGTLVEEARWKLGFEVYTLSGIKLSQGASESGPINAAKHRETYELLYAQALKYWRDNPGKRGRLTDAAKFIQRHWVLARAPLSISRILHILSKFPRP